MRAAVLILMLVVAKNGVWSSPSSPKGVTNEDIRDAILSLVHMFRDIADKLMRHEHREKGLGDHVKRALDTLDKRQRTLEQHTDVVAASLAGIGERLHVIEGKLSQDNERDMTANTVETLQQGWMTGLETMMRNYSVPKDDKSSSIRLDAMEAALGARLDTVTAVAERLEAAVLRPTPSSTDDEWIRSYLDKQQRELADIKAVTTTVSSSVAGLPTREQVAHHFNVTDGRLQEAKYELSTVTEKAVLSLQMKVDESFKSHAVGQEGLRETLANSSALAENAYSDVLRSYEQLLKEVKGFTKVEQVMIQTADNVMDTKRRIEYGTHQVLLEIGELVKVQVTELNTTVNRRFDNISFTILANQKGGLTNLSSKIENEISQVWRQISIMHQQLTQSAGDLEKLQQQTDAYVNGSLQSMNSMEGKVVQIMGRMVEVDEHLNFLLGKISLFTQEFNQIKSDLGEKLENIKISFKTVQEQIKDVGPGPNPISAEAGVDDIDNAV